MYASMLNCFSHVQLFLTLMTIACQVPLSMVFRRQEYWSGLPCPPPGDHPNPGIEPTSLRYPALVYRFFITSAPLEVLSYVYFITKRKGKNEENTCITAYFATECFWSDTREHGENCLQGKQQTSYLYGLLIKDAIQFSLRFGT